LRQRLPTRPSDPTQNLPEAILLAYLERYGEGLCGHPVVRDHSGCLVAVVTRTNNVLEQFFPTAKQGLHRCLGRAHLGRDLEDQPAQVALVANLHAPRYVRILCGCLDHLLQAFAALDCPAAPDPSRLQRNNRDAPLRRNRAWANDATQAPSPPPAVNTQASTPTGHQRNSDAVDVYSEGPHSVLRLAFEQTTLKGLSTPNVVARRLY